MASMHIAIIASKQGGKTYSSKLLRRSYRDAQGRVQKKTLANLSCLSDETIELIRGSLKGKQYVEADAAFEVLRSRSHGAVEAVCVAFQRLALPALLGSTPCRERNLACAMIAARIIRPHTKLDTTRWWEDTTLEETFGIEGAKVEELYAAMDWLLLRQDRIQARLARRHFRDGGLVLFDVSSSQFEGSACSPARRGHNRDGKKSKLQVNYGLLCDVRGRPVAVSVMEGNAADSAALLPEVERLRTRFGLQRMAVVGDHGMIAQVRIDELRQLGGVDWITALKSVSIRKLLRKGILQPARFDDVNLFEILHPDYPGERLVACRNPRLVGQRARTREALMRATEASLDELRQRVSQGTLSGKAEIALQVGERINRWKMKEHFQWEISDDSLSVHRKADSIAQEAALDGIYVIRTSLAESDMNTADCVRSYQALTRVERAFRSIRTVSLRVRPIHHRTADRVRAHIFLCMLAHYVEWNMRQAWTQLLFVDPELEQDAWTRDPVAPAERSEAAERKVATATLDDGSPAWCFRTLIGHLESIARNSCRPKLPRPRTATKTPEVFDLTTTPTEQQQKALEMLKTISPN